MFAAAGGLAVGLAGAAAGDLLSEEVRERADRVPFWLIERAGRRLSPALRDELEGEWAAELHAILARRGADRLPVTRFVIGTRYALGLLRSAGAVECALRGDGRCRPALRPGLCLATVRTAVPAARAGCFGVGFGAVVGAGADVGTTAGVVLGLAAAVGALLLGVLVGARLVPPAALGVGLGAGLSAHLGVTGTSVSFAVGGVLVAALAGTLLAGPAERAGRPGSRTLWPGTRTLWPCTRILRPGSRALWRGRRGHRWF